MTTRTMLYLDAEQLEALKERALAERVSVTELVRRLIRQYLGQAAMRPGPPTDWSRLVGIGASGEPGISESHDRALGAALAREHLR